MATIAKINPRTGEKISRAYLESLPIGLLAFLYKDIFHDSPHCHSEEPYLKKTIIEAILTGKKQVVPDDVD